MKLKKLKQILDSLTPEQLEQNLLYRSERYSVSGIVETIKKAPHNLYYTGEDDPAQLYTKNQLKNDVGMESDEIERLSIKYKGEPEVGKQSN
jgi:hypothetical protein